jgi:hypothetical protein
MARAIEVDRWTPGVYNSNTAHRRMERRRIYGIGLYVKKRNLEELAGNVEWYPYAPELVGMVFAAIEEVVPDSLIPEEVARITEAVFTAFTDADIRGLFSVADEHEWARLALMARQLHEAGDINSPYPQNAHPCDNNCSASEIMHGSCCYSN